MNIHQRENFFFNDEITILFLFTYSVCDEKVKRDRENSRERIIGTFVTVIRFILSDVKNKIPKAPGENKG